MNVINYQIWLNLFALSVELFCSFPVNEGFSCRTYWDATEKAGFTPGAELKTLYIEFYNTETGERLISYSLVPWQDLYPSDKAETIIANEPVLLTVNSFCLVFQSGLIQDPTEEEVVYLEKITNFAEDLLDVEKNQELMEESDAHRLSGNISLINQKSHPCYVEIEVAVPGSGSIHPGEIRKSFPKKMIKLHRIPDTGYVETSWLCPDSLPLPEKNPEAISVLDVALRKCAEHINMTSRDSIRMHASNQLKSIFGDNTESFNTFFNLLNKLTLVTSSSHSYIMM